MTSRASYNKRYLRTRDKDLVLVQTRSNIFYGIEIKKLDEQKTSVVRNITVTPSIIFHTNFTKAFIDYSDYSNNKEKNEIAKFFDIIPVDSNFTLTQGSWVNNLLSKTTYSLNGTYKFSKIVDDIIFVDVVSVTSYSTDILRYDKEFFTDTPVIEFSTTIDKNKKETKTLIINHFGKNSKNSFAYLGIEAGDYIQLQNKKDKYKIDSLIVDDEGKELLTVIGNLDTVDLRNTATLIIIFQENKSNTDTTVDNTKLGKCETFNGNVVVSCTSNSTKLQCDLRKDTSNNLSTSFKENYSCDLNSIQNIAQTLKSIKNQETFRLEKGIFNRLVR